MVHHTKCSHCGARNTIPPTGLTMVCEYCGFSRPVPDADKRRKKMEREEARRRKQHQAQQRAAAKKAARQAQHREVKRRTSVGRWLSLVILLIAIGPVVSVLYRTPGVGNSIKRLFGRPVAGGAAEPGATLAIDRSAQRYFDRGAKALRNEGYAQQRDARGGDTADALTLEVKRGTCYALLVASRQQIELVRLIVPGTPVIARPTRFLKRQVVARHCPDDNGKVRAMVTLRRSGTYAWGVFTRPYAPASTTEAKPRAGGAGAEKRRKTYSNRPNRGKPAAKQPDRTKPPAKTPEKQGWTPHEEF